MALRTNPIEGLSELVCGRVLLNRIEDGGDVWLVGGAVRDLLLGRTPREIDLVTRDGATEVGARLGEVIEEHDRFGTVRARADECVFDVAQTRTESYPSPGALPEVELGAPLTRDLERRDFTINAVAMTFGGELIEYPGALADLEAGVLRVLHDGSFVDDPTRLWRLVRYAVRLGFRIDPHTSELASAAVEAAATKTVSGDRIGAELRLALSEPDPLATLHAAQNLGLTAHVRLDPALTATALKILPPGGRGDLVVIGAAATEDTWVSGLGFSAAELAVIRHCISAPPAPAGPPSRIAAVLRDLPDEAVAVAGARGDRFGAERWLLDLRDIRLEIDGDDLIAAGVERGPDLGRRLRRTLDLKLDGLITGRDAELAEALR